MQDVSEKPLILRKMRFLCGRVGGLDSWGLFHVGETYSEKPAIVPGS